MRDLEHAQMMLTVARRDLRAMEGMKAHAALMMKSLVFMPNKP